VAAVWVISSFICISSYGSAIGTSDRTSRIGVIDPTKWYRV